MPKIYTCGHPSKRTTFSYRGSSEQGITLEFDSGDYFIDAQTIQDVLNHFRGQTVRGGFSMTDPTPGGVGAYLSGLRDSLTPRHASFLCAALLNEGLVECELVGSAVVVSFLR